MAAADRAPEPPDVRIVLSTAPPGTAHEIARTLVAERFAACVNLVPGVRSVYRWKGAVQDDPETVLWMKTTAGRLAGLEARLRELHPYEVPEIVVLVPSAGSADYFAWVRESCEGEGLPPVDRAAAGPRQRA
jgi:periplasmic divalent cation tolerance protein